MVPPFIDRRPSTNIPAHPSLEKLIPFSSLANRQFLRREFGPPILTLFCSSELLIASHSAKHSHHEVSFESKRTTLKKPCDLTFY
jgi:hypothetical protein